jgi:hypothetical protein
MSNILSVSLSNDQITFIDEMGLSPSKLLQSKIEETIENYKVTAEELKKQQHKINFLMETINKQRDFIEAKGLMNEFCEKC